jgi:hypothetical protein
LKKKQTIISNDAEKAFGNSQHSSMKRNKNKKLPAD